MGTGNLRPEGKRDQEGLAWHVPELRLSGENDEEQLKGFQKEVTQTYTGQLPASQITDFKGLTMEERIRNRLL